MQPLWHPASPRADFVPAGSARRGRPARSHRLFQDLKDTERLAELGVLFLLFEMGLELSLDRLKVRWANGRRGGGWGWGGWRHMFVGPKGCGPGAGCEGRIRLESMRQAAPLQAGAGRHGEAIRRSIGTGTMVGLYSHLRCTSTLLSHPRNATRELCGPHSTTPIPSPPPPRTHRLSPSTRSASAACRCCCARASSRPSRCRRGTASGPSSWSRWGLALGRRHNGGVGEVSRELPS